MVDSLMLCGIGFLAGCLLTLAIIPLVHERAVRLTSQKTLETVPFALTEIRAEKDLLRAQFAMAIRRLEVNVEEMRDKGASQLSELGRKHAEIRDLKVELDKRAALILAMRARLQVRQSMTRRIVKVLLFIFMRSGRGRKRAPFVPRQISTTMAAPHAGVVDKAAA
jgi:hypothetical protein